MTGLLDWLKSDDPAVRQGLLQAGLSLLQSKGNLGNALGQAGMTGLLGSQQYRQNQLQQKRQGLQDELIKNQLDQQRREAEIAKLPGQFFRPPSAPVVDATGGMETAQEAPQNANAGGMDVGGYTRALMGIDPLKALQFQAATAKQEPTLREIDPTKTYGTWEGGRFNPVVRGAPKPDKGSDDMQEFLFAEARGEVKPGQSFTEWMRANKKAGAASVSVSTGQKGYENESKLRNDFKSEPIYKDFQDMQSAHKQIKAGIAQGTPIGDVATATKIMKLLDPGSVVRESELGIAMAAGGRMDRLQNYVQMQLSGEKLTPQMRKEFGSLADELYKAAAQSYNSKRAEYEQMGKRYQLDPSVLGAPASAPKASSVDDLVNKYRSK